MSEVPSIQDIIVTDCGGEWETKSGGLLNVVCRFDFNLVQKFFSYDPNEITSLKNDIRGLRSYRVQNVPIGSVGANEWHKVRNELVFALSGSFKWTCQDKHGDTVEYIVDGHTAIFTPHHILHTYEALEDDTTIGVIANTLYLPEATETHDTFPVDAFSVS